MTNRSKRTYGGVPPKNDKERPQRPHVTERSFGQTKRVAPQKKSTLSYAVKVLGAGLLGVFRLLVALPMWLLGRISKKRPTGGMKKYIRPLINLAILGVIAGFLVVAGLFVVVSKDLPDPDKLTEKELQQSTQIFDRTGEEKLFEIFSEQKRTFVRLEDIPQDVIDGVVATEDTAFYTHKGVRPLSIIRSVVLGVLGQGRIGGGASTLTQQLVKNAILSPERTITRKAKEIIVAVRLEQKYSKDQILQIYFNEIPYGSTNYGIQAAAQSYFGKDVQELSLAESATLAGIPKQPTRYLNDLEKLEVRRNFVLKRMFDEGFITEEEKNAAQAEPLEMNRSFNDIKAPHFVLSVKEQLVELYGEQKVEQGGLRVITSLDWDLQQKAETAVTEESEKVFEEANANNTALVAIDPDNGHVLALVGSRDFYDKEIHGQFNVATLGRRQPGSSFKPIIYTAAFEKGYTPQTVLFDVVTNFATTGDDYTPLNYDLQEHGPVTMRHALQGSLNIPAVKAQYLVGEKEGVEFAERLGYTTLEANNFGLSLVLGGGEVKLLEHVNAYTSFANGGELYAPVSILKVEDSNGDVLHEWKKKRGTRILEEDVATTISNVLQDDAARAYAFGAGGVLTLPERPVAAKTGTTNGYVDAWTLGYTPSLVAGVWAGNTDNTAMTVGYGGSKVAAPIWNRFMRDALEGKPVEEFPSLPERTVEKPVLLGGEGGGITLLIDKVTGKIATSSTPDQYIVERTYIQPHSILHYVDLDDPQGNIPEDPTVDPQYEIWEAAIQEWITRKKEENPEWDISFEEPPTEKDDIHSLELIPTLEVVHPAPSSTIYSRLIQTDIRVTAPRGVTKVSYRIDGRNVGVITAHPFNLSYNAQEFEAGNHTLTIIVEDDVGNRLEEEVPFTLEAGDRAGSVQFVALPEKIARRDFPRTFFLQPVNLDKIKEVVLEAQSTEGTIELARVSDFSNLFNGQIAVTWQDKPRDGFWTLRARVTQQTGGEQVVSEEIEIK